MNGNRGEVSKMTGGAAQSNESDPRREAAAGWHARLQAPDAAVGDWEAFTQWLEADPANRIAFDEVELLSAEIEDNKGRLRALVRPATADVIALSSTRRNWARALAAIAAVMLAIAGIQQYLATRPMTQVYATGAGERRTITLADGSAVTLNAMTRISSRIGGGERQLALEGGEALFEVAHDENRPFVVSVAGQEVRDVGTVFNVLSRPDGMAVTVVEGMVDVGSPDDGPQGRTRLPKGKRLVYDRAADQAVVSTVNTANATAWRSGRLVYDDAPLPEVAADIGRYLGRPVAIKGKASHLRFTGVLILGKEADMLRNLEALVPVTVRRSAQDIVIFAR